MKTLTIAVATALVLAGCEEKKPAPPAPTAARTPSPLEKAGTEVAGATSSAGATLREQRDRLAAQSQARIDDVKAQVEQWKARNSGLADDAKAGFDRAVAEIDAAASATREKLDSLRQGADSAFQKASDEIAAAMGRLNQAYNDAKAKYGR